ncbi:ABC transporter ATP-binding protein [Hydrogenophaga sp.]|uniref:ABC transporter ATP-binding protein n=1 Tax=Hydrogenophaga sp. TaxID=1904254 RepID=UPI002733A410|nr:ABC transporter ATP-binding protein [Hydrogenophaga sp.]MDP3806150.1 ABC transporter ATP-binding protein [Hydrogenophaga sp.]
MKAPHLSLKDVHAYYGESHILHGMSFDVHEGECVALLGRNGAGRTTTLRAILGLVDKRRGSIKIGQTETIGLPTHRIARLGVGFCPEERAIYSSLSCEENLLLPPQVGPGGMSLEEIYQLFPNLAERRHSRGTSLSGGEQQMLALARILRTGARLLLLDEISEGLAPVIVDRLAEVIVQLRGRGYTILLVEQNFNFAADLVDRMYLIEHGEVIRHIAGSELQTRYEEIEKLLGI